MSTNKTPNYQLHAWAPEDEYLRTELNANFTKLDTALKAEVTARAGAVNTLNTALAGKAAIVTGSYTGDGGDTRTIQLGFTPRMVFVMAASGDIREGSYTYGGMALNGQEGQAVAVVNGGFSVRYYSGSNYLLCSNREDRVYYYWALR